MPLWDGSFDGSGSSGMPRPPASNVALGSAIMLLSAVLYAGGLIVQRAAMTTHVVPAPGCRSAFARKHSSWAWLLGLLIYAFGGLGLGTVALSYIPLALCSSLFTTTLFWNAIIAYLWLGEELATYDLWCYLVIAGGVTLTAVFLPKETELLRIHESSELFMDRSALIYWSAVGALLTYAQVLILFVYEKQHADPVHHYAKCNRNIYRTAMIVYPTTLGVLEGLGYVGLKVVSNWYGHWSVGADEGSTEHAFFWVGMTTGPALVILITIWLKKCYLRFPVTEIFPVELAALTITSVTGGLFVHDEYSLLPVLNAVFVAIGLAVLLGAMLVLALFKSAHLRNQVKPDAGVADAQQPTTASGTRDGAGKAHSLSPPRCNFISSVDEMIEDFPQEKLDRVAP